MHFSSAIAEYYFRILTNDDIATTFLPGDEMGLGKTVQVAAYLAALKRSKLAGQTEGRPLALIVCPATVLGQWVSELPVCVTTSACLCLDSWLYPNPQNALDLMK